MSAEDLRDQKTHFAFGKNWLDYARAIDDARIGQAVSDLQHLSGERDLHGKSFLDVGCGSGIHALAALRMGAARVVATDIDPDSVSAARATIARFVSASTSATAVEFEVCSVFDMPPETFGTFDIVYSWGVLHHTGDMHRAIGCAAALVAPNGQLLLALYKKTPFCGMWRHIKRWYSRTTPTQQARARKFYVLLKRIAARLRGRNFDDYVRDYGERRGMDFYHDVHDWLGGYPYESISPDECHALLAHMQFSVAREFISTPSRYLRGLLGSGCDEYAFRRTAELS